MKDLKQLVNEVKSQREKIAELWQVRDKAKCDADYKTLVAIQRDIVNTKALLLDAERELVEACVLLSDGYDLALLPKQAVRQ